MNFKDKLDFCLIQSPYNGQSKTIVFITSRGLDYIDETIIMCEEYRKTKSLLENNGLLEIDLCCFESHSEIDAEKLIVKLEDKGIKYSKFLEIKISKELEDLKSQYSKNSFETDVVNAPSVFLDPNSKIELDLTKVKIPNIGEKMSLFFYLFLECHFINEEDCFLMLNGEFYTNENNHFRNFLKIAKSDFTRIESDIKNVIVLQSTKKYKDFSSEVNILQNGSFRSVKPYYTDIGQKGYKTKEYNYSFVEIKKNINPEHHIVIQVSLDGYFNQMMERSKEIKKELVKTKKNTISIDFIKSEIGLIKSKLETKMIDSAESDQYERASYFKNNINILEQKLEIINDISEVKITLAEYMKIFSLD